MEELKTSWDHGMKKKISFVSKEEIAQYLEEDPLLSAIEFIQAQAVANNLGVGLHIIYVGEDSREYYADSEVPKGLAKGEWVPSYETTEKL